MKFLKVEISWFEARVSSGEATGPGGAWRWRCHATLLVCILFPCGAFPCTTTTTITTSPSPPSSLHLFSINTRLLLFQFQYSSLCSIPIIMAVVAKVQELIDQNPLVVFSKTTCPFCRSVKALLKDLGAEAKVVELDKESDGPEIQKALAEISKQRTVPNVFIGGEHIGGNDATKAAHKKGDLVPMLKKAGVLKDEEKTSVEKIEAESAKAGGGVQDLVKGVEEDTTDKLTSKDVVA